MRLLNLTHACAFVAVSACTLAAPLRTQEPAIKGAAALDSTQRLIRDDSAGNCARAAQALRSRPSRADGWALRLAPRCGAAGGRALAQAIQTVSTSRDSAFTTSVLAAGIHFDDADLFQAHLRTAGDATATPAARVLALRNALSQISPVQFLFDAADMAEHGAGCMPSRFSHGHKAQGDVLPSDAARQLELVAARVAESDREPSSVRMAAQCAAAKAVRYGELRR